MIRPRHISLLLLLSFLTSGCSPFGGGSVIPAEFHPGISRYAVEVSNVFPTGSATDGGARIRVTGTSFRDGATVMLGNAECTEVTVESETELTCTAAAHVGATVDVTVTNDDGQAGTFESGFLYSAAFVTVTSITASPTANPGEVLVVIFGKNFQNGATVTIDGKPCAPVTFVASTELRCTITPQPPSGSDVVVTNPGGGARDTGGLLDGFEVNENAAPILFSISPAQGTIAGGTTLTVNGNFFRDGVTVQVGGSPCTSPVLVSATQLTCTTPAHAAGTVSIKVTNDDAKFSSLGTAYTYGSWTYAAEVDNDNPVIYYRLNEASGGTANDTSGHPSGAINASIFNVPVLNQAGPIVNDATSKSIRFQGSGNQRVLTGGQAYAKTTVNIAHTVELWVRPVTVSSVVTLIGLDAGTAFAWDFQLGPGNKVYWAVQGDASTLREYNASLVGAWHHLVFVKLAGGDTGDLYVDGVKKAVFSGALNAVNISIPNSILIGGSSSGANVLDGNLSEVAFYDYALSEERIKFHYQIGIGQ